MILCMILIKIRPLTVMSIALLHNIIKIASRGYSSLGFDFKVQLSYLNFIIRERMADYMMQYIISV
jgi:hypothetical protein